MPAGAINLATEVLTAASWPSERTGWVTAPTAPVTSPIGSGRKGRSRCGAGPGPGSACRVASPRVAGRSGTEGSKRWASTARPPTPSMSAWWTFITSAARSPTPSTRTASHSGSAASNPLVAMVWAMSRTSRRFPCPARRMRRRCVSSSKDASGTNCGRPRPGARFTARERRRGTANVRAPTRARTSAQSGLPSRTMMATMVGRITGSALIVHSSASEPLMVSAPGAHISSPPMAQPLLGAIVGSGRPTGIEPEVPNSGRPGRRCVFGPFRAPPRRPSICPGLTSWLVRNGPSGA